jgi:hypothetical protein
MQMAFKPNGKVTRDLLMSARTLVTFAMLYAVLLVCSWSPGSLDLLLPGSFEEGVKNLKVGKLSVQFLPTTESVGKLLAEPMAALSAWAHLQFVSFFCARWIWMDGEPLCLSQFCRRAHAVCLYVTGSGHREASLARCWKPHYVICQVFSGSSVPCLTLSLPGELHALANDPEKAQKLMRTVVRVSVTQSHAAGPLLVHDVAQSTVEPDRGIQAHDLVGNRVQAW